MHEIGKNTKTHAAPGERSEMIQFSNTRDSLQNTEHINDQLNCLSVLPRNAVYRGRTRKLQCGGAVAFN